MECSIGAFYSIDGVSRDGSGGLGIKYTVSINSRHSDKILK
jgi:hypothetical protein